MFYGGAAGGGKSDLALGLAITDHQRSVIFRHIHEQLTELIDRSHDIIGRSKSISGVFNYNTKRWRFHDGRMVRFGGLQYEKDREKWKGRPHDLIVFDELADFTESQYRFVIAWNRSIDPEQRCRVVGTSNPPSNEIGEWMIKYWGPWLDPMHPDPAAPGELRWYANVNGQDEECTDGEPFEYEDEKGHVEIIFPRSRTFIPAKLEDNPILSATGYRAVLQNLPEPLRSQLLYGDFLASREDDRWQVIPSDWVDAAQARWQATERPMVKSADGDYVTPLSALGCDIAMGGKDRTTICARYGVWFDVPESLPGVETPTSRESADFIINALASSGGGYAVVDCNGVGALTFGVLKKEGWPVRSYVGSGNPGQRARDKSRRYSFTNVRAAAWWKMREDLDPTSGKKICLPPGRDIKTELCSARWEPRPGAKIQIEEKEKIRERMGGKSPDLADAIVMANYVHPTWAIEEQRGTQRGLVTIDATKPREKAVTVFDPDY